MGAFNYSTTAGSNTSVGGVSIAEGMSRANVNNAMRAQMADLAKLLKDQGGALTTTGSADAYVLTTNSTLTAPADGQRLVFIASFTCSGPSTLNPDVVGAKAIRKLNDQALASGDIVQAGIYAVHYDASANSAAGAWLLESPVGSYSPGGTDVAIADGGTGQSTASAAFQALSPQTTRGDLIIGGAAGPIRLALGASGLALLSDGTDGGWGAVYRPGATDVAVADGGTGASTAGDARTNLGFSANGASLVTAADYAAMRALLDLEPNTDFYAPAGTDVAIADGGTGASSATTGFNALSPVTARGDIIVRGATNNDRLALGASGTVLRNDGTDVVWGKLDTTNFTTNVVDTDIALAADSDTRLASQKAVKSYVDSAVVGQAPTAPVNTATTANITLSGEQTLDGVLTSASRVLVWKQTAATENGIYVSAAGAWARATDADAGSEFPRLTTFVTAGTLYGGGTFTCQNASAPTLGVTNIVFVQTGNSTVYSASTGLQLVGSTFSISDAELLALAGLTSAADKVPYFTGSGAAAVADLTTAGRALIDDANAGAQRTTLGVGTGDSPQFTAVNIGDAADTTLSRASAGEIAVEGNQIYRAGGVDIPVSDGGTGASTAAAARSSLGLAIGTDVLAYSAPVQQVATQAGAFTTNTGGISIADDAATTITFSFSTFAAGVLVIAGNSDAGGSAIVAFRVGSSPYCTEIQTPSSVVSTTTGVLAGTTGTDTQLTISAHTDGKLYIENRTGASRTYNVSILALTATASIASIP